jgi:hypothetical protein
MKKLGIWIDKEKAHIVTLENKNEELHSIFSGVENFHPGGGSGTKGKGGPQDVVQDSKYLEREKHQLKAYFKKISEKLKDASEIVILGPGEVCKKLNNELKDNYSNIGANIVDIKTTDKMTDNQLKAWLRDFYDN